MLRKLLGRILCWREDNYEVITLYFNRLNFNRFKALMEQSGEDDPRQVLREALRVYEYLVLEEKVGTEFFVKDKETGNLCPTLFFVKNKIDHEDEWWG